MLHRQGNTDPSQPVDSPRLVNARCSSCCHGRRHPLSIITKGERIRRDLDLPQALAE
ncbi:MAG: hypothetical protein IPF50_18680 [Proteobacteria bacterium]|nr:hypothetical protein [Pseudomonadota bacterium]